MKNEHFITFEIIDVGIYSIKLKNFGDIGDLVLNEKDKLFYFFPKDNFSYKPIMLAIILNKLNELNDYKKEAKNV